jgi:aldose 1-epimerase
MRASTGEQFVLTRSTPSGPAEAIITEVAASIRTLRINGVDLTQPYPEHVPPPFGCGIVLAEPRQGRRLAAQRANPAACAV